MSHGPCVVPERITNTLFLIYVSGSATGPKGLTIRRRDSLRVSSLSCYGKEGPQDQGVDPCGRRSVTPLGSPT